MSGTIILKNSNTASAVPLAADLQVGEVAVNTADGAMYTKHSDGTVKTIGADALALKAPLASPTLSNPTYTGTLTGSTGILNIGSGQVYKDASGNVGIGTSTPTSKLTVGTPFAQTPGVSASFSSATPTFFSGQGTVSIGSTDAVSVDKGGVLTFNANTTTLNGFPVCAIAGKTEAIGAGVYSGYLQFITSSSGGITLERMRIDSSGNVGIGTSSPTGKLDVAGTIKTLGYTVATLPTGVTGARAYVTNALAPTYGATVVAGGAVVIPVFYNGTNWIVG